MLSLHSNIYAKKKGIAKKLIVAGDFNGTAWLRSSWDQHQVYRRSFLQTLRCQHRWALHNCGDPNRFQKTGLMSVGSLNNLLKIGIGRYACMVRSFSIPRKTLGLRPTDQSCHHETWLHQDFVDWRNSQSHHEEPDRRMLLKERPEPHHQGAKKRRISDIMSDHSLSS